MKKKNSSTFLADFGASKRWGPFNHISGWCNDPPG